jgi:hypothetical protein
MDQAAPVARHPGSAERLLRPAAATELPACNACLTCPVFITTPEFLPQHREQLELTRGIVERAQQRGRLRLVEMNQRTADNLTKIIDSLENDSTTAGPSENDAC